MRRFGRVRRRVGFFVTYVGRTYTRRFMLKSYICLLILSFVRRCMAFAEPLYNAM